MRCLLFIITLLLSACGGSSGGGGNPDPDPDPGPDPVADLDNPDLTLELNVVPADEYNIGTLFSWTYAWGNPSTTSYGETQIRISLTSDTGHDQQWTDGPEYLSVGSSFSTPISFGPLAPGNYTIKAELLGRGETLTHTFTVVQLLAG